MAGYTQFFFLLCVAFHVLTMCMFRTFLLLSLVYIVLCQRIQDIWQTTWDQSSLLCQPRSSTPIEFTSPGPSGDADILIHYNQKYQRILGFGAALTDSSATVLSKLRSQNYQNYQELLNSAFSPQGAGLNYIRIPLGASDFSAKRYSLADQESNSFSSFDINQIPSNVFSILQDIVGVNKNVKIHLCPWSPPTWVKDSYNSDGGKILSQYVPSYATYLLKAVQGFKNKGFPVAAVSIQNEPKFSNPTYPTCQMTHDQEGQIGVSLRNLLNSNGFSSVKIVGFEFNWSHASTYPIKLIEDYGKAFDGVAFHCYEGDVTDQDIFYKKFPSKSIYFTECTAVFTTDWWQDVQNYAKTLSIGAIKHNAVNVLMWNLALDGQGLPKLPDTNSCGIGCRGLITVNSDGSYFFNPEFYSLAQVSKAAIPEDAGGQFGQRLGISLSGPQSLALLVTAFVTPRVSPSDPARYSLVVLNSDENNQPVQTTIEFQGKQATYTFPAGITTLTWFDSNTTTTVANQEQCPMNFRQNRRRRR